MSYYRSLIQYGATYDADAQAFLTATGTPNDGTIFFAGTNQQITGLQISQAVNNLVLSLKANSIWSKIIMLNPKILGTATAHKFNLKDPRDLDIAYRQTYSGTWVRSGLGAQANGTNAYANTFVNFNTLGLTSNLSLGYYLTVPSTLYGDKHGMGAYSAGNRWVGIEHGSVVQVWGKGYGGNGSLSNSGGVNKGFTALSIIGTQKKVYNQSFMSTHVTDGVGVPTNNVWEGALNVTNTYYSGINATFGTSFAGYGLTETEMGNLRSAVETFETALFRNA